MQARVPFLDGELIRQGAVFQQPNDPVAKAFIAPAQSVDVLFKVAPAQKPCQGVLLEAGDRGAVEPQLLLEFLHQRPGQHHVADSDGGRQALGEGVHVDDPAAVIQGLEGRHRVGVEAELTVVIVLDDVAVSFLRPAQQFQPPPHRRHQSQGEVVVGGTVEDLGVFQRFRPDAVFVQSRADAGGTRRGVNSSDLAVARLFHREAFVPAQQLDEKIIQKVRARADEDAAFIHLHPPERRQMLRDGGAQRRDAGVGTLQQQLFAVVQHHFPQEPGPDRKGELPGRAAGEIQLGRDLHTDRGRDDPGGGMAFHRLHEVAHLFPGTDVPLRQKLGVGRLHGDLADFQV